MARTGLPDDRLSGPRTKESGADGRTVGHLDSHPDRRYCASQGNPRRRRWYRPHHGYPDRVFGLDAGAGGGREKSSGKSTTQPAVFGRIPAPCGRVPGMISRNVTACSSSRGTAPRGRARGRGQDLRAGGRVRPRPAAPAGHGRSDAGGWPAPGGRCRRAPDEDRGLRRSPRRPRRSRVWARRHQHAPGRGRAAARYQIATAQGITRSRRGPAGVFSLWPDGGGARAPRLAKRPDQL